MKRAMALARRGRGRVAPNPMVGAVVVHSGRVVGEGYHRVYGGPHAEVTALRAAGMRARGATLYVTLEPCSYHGKTPPCTGLVIRSGIRSVVAAVRDANPRVNGKGFAVLKRHGIHVITGVLQDQARDLNREFFAWHRRRRPFVMAKWAMSLDGKIATSSGDSKWISSVLSRTWAGGLRKEAHAIMVGIGTVLADDPMLVWNEGAEANPIRVVLDRRARIPLTSRLVRTAARYRTWVVVTKRASAGKLAALEKRGCRICVQGSGGLKDVLKQLGAVGCTRVLIEGGGAVLGSAFDEGVVDEVCAFVSPVVLGGERAVTAVGGHGVSGLLGARRLRNIRVRRFGADVMIRGTLA